MTIDPATGAIILAVIAALSGMCLAIINARSVNAAAAARATAADAAAAADRVAAADERLAAAQERRDLAAAQRAMLERAEEAARKVDIVAEKAEIIAQKAFASETKLETIAVTTAKSAANVNGNLSKVQEQLTAQTRHSEALQATVATQIEHSKALQSTVDMLAGIIKEDRATLVDIDKTVNGTRAPLPVAIVPASEPLPVDVTEKRKP